ncbi:hypothetical protein H9L39_19996 [Fusarium oxysporum f. sp. albedinis]|nr:hypothetical protein H9L39_19996 [Fusarium oxysporum f. sp. albedinis]
MRVSILSVLAFLSPLAIAGPVAVESSADGLQERQTPSYDCLNVRSHKPWNDNLVTHNCWSMLTIPFYGSAVRTFAMVRLEAAMSLGAEMDI